MINSVSFLSWKQWSCESILKIISVFQRYLLNIYVYDGG